MAVNEKDDLVYHTIEDAIDAPPSTWVNLIGVVAEFSLVKRAARGGKDYYRTVKIYDESFPYQGFAVTVFSRDKEKLPKISYEERTIVCFHQVKVEAYQGEIFCCFDKKRSSFALYDGKHTDASLDPYDASTNYQPVACLSEFLAQLRRFDGMILSTSLLRFISNDECSDLICQVWHVCEKSGSEVTIFIYDGTDAPPAVLETELDTEVIRPMPLYFEESPLSREILGSFPCCGTVLRITATNASYDDFQHLQKNGCWAKLCNVSCKLESGIWTGTMDNPKFFILPVADVNVKLQKRVYTQRSISMLEKTPMTCFPQCAHLTEINDDNAIVPYMTLMDSILYPQTVHKFKTIVRVVASCPWRGESVCDPCGGSYPVRLTLEDPTARIHVYILEGGKFFRDNVEAGELTRKMMGLLGISENPAFRNPPWIWCCLMSSCKDHDDQQVLFREFAIWIEESGKVAQVGTHGGN